MCGRIRSSSSVIISSDLLASKPPLPAPMAGKAMDSKPSLSANVRAFETDRRIEYSEARQRRLIVYLIDGHGSNLKVETLFGQFVVSALVESVETCRTVCDVLLNLFGLFDNFHSEHFLAEVPFV
jgi:hypothetical protein